MKRIFVLFSVLLLLFPFQIVASAETGDLNDYREFDSFMKRYHEHTMELTYFINASYNSNDHYFKENFDVFRNIVNQVYDTNKHEITRKYMDSAEGLFSKPIALLATANDLRGYLWDKMKGLFGRDEVDDSYVFRNSDSPFLLGAPDGYSFVNTDRDNGNVYSVLGLETSLTSQNCGRIKVYLGNYSNVVGSFDFGDSTLCSGSVGSIQYFNSINEMDSSLFSMSVVHSIYQQARVPLNVVLRRNVDSTNHPIIINRVPDDLQRVVNNIVNNYDSNNTYNEDYTPTVSPQLVCPNEVVPLQFTEGVFKTIDGQVVTIQEDETANYLQTLCDLDFAFPQIDYHGNTGLIVVGGLPLEKQEMPISPIDVGLVEYVRNSYNYATSVINSGVNGLKSIAAGTAGLVTFSGSLFGFLPPELLTLFIGGFSVALGLWVFKK